MSEQTTPNPVDDTRFTRPLIRALTQHVDAFVQDLAEQAARDRERRAGHRIELVAHVRYQDEIFERMAAGCPHR